MTVRAAAHRGRHMFPVLDRGGVGGNGPRHHDVHHMNTADPPPADDSDDGRGEQHKDDNGADDNPQPTKQASHRTGHLEDVRLRRAGDRFSFFGSIGFRTLRQGSSS